MAASMRPRCFVGVLGAVSRWGFAKETIAAPLPNADRALDWVRDYGDRDGDGSSNMRPE